MRVWHEEEIAIKDAPPGTAIFLRGILNQVSPTIPLIEIELIISQADPEEDIVKQLYQHNPSIGHHEFSLDDVLAKYSPKINKLRERISKLDYQAVRQI